MKYYSFTGTWPIFRKVDGKYYWLRDDGEWLIHHNGEYLVSPKELTANDIRGKMSQYREGTEAALIIKRIIFYQEVLWE